MLTRVPFLTLFLLSGACGVEWEDPWSGNHGEDGAIYIESSPGEPYHVERANREGREVSGRGMSVVRISATAPPEQLMSRTSFLKNSGGQYFRRVQLEDIAVTLEPFQGVYFVRSTPYDYIIRWCSYDGLAEYFLGEAKDERREVQGRMQTHVIAWLGQMTAPNCSF